MGYDEATMNEVGDAILNGSIGQGHVITDDDKPVVEIDLQELSDAFDQACQAKHEMGREKYGEGTWLKADTIAMMMDEVIDMSNYARFTWIRLAIMKQMMDAVAPTEEAQPLPGKEALGKGAFLPAGRGHGGGLE